jgi:hypothetical protein
MDKPEHFPHTRQCLWSFIHMIAVHTGSLQAALHPVCPWQMLTTGHFSQLTCNCSVDIQMLLSASHVGKAEWVCTWVSVFRQVDRKDYLFVIFIWWDKKKRKNLKLQYKKWKHPTN